MMTPEALAEIEKEKRAAYDDAVTALARLQQANDRHHMAKAGQGANAYNRVQTLHSRWREWAEGLLDERRNGVDDGDLDRYLRDQLTRRMDLAPLTLGAVEADVAAWQAATFPAGTLRGQAAHLLKEAKELAQAAEAFAKRKDEPVPEWLTDAIAEDERVAAELKEEIADVFMMLVAVSRTARIHLGRAVADKLKINKGRTWGTPGPDGAIHHVKPLGFCKGCGEAIAEHTITHDCKTGPNAKPRAAVVDEPIVDTLHKAGTGQMSNLRGTFCGLHVDCEAADAKRMEKDGQPADHVGRHPK